MVNQELVIETLRKVPYPGYSRDIVSFGLVRDVNVKEGNVEVLLEVNTQQTDIPKKIKGAVEEKLKDIEDISSVEVVVSVHSGDKAEEPEDEPTDQLGAVQKIIAVASGKGGVGKSTFVCNLASTMARKLKGEGKQGVRVGIMDCDIYGPSIPLMMGANGRPHVENQLIHPIVSHGVKIMSMGFLIDEDAPVIWRGPMVMKAIQQFAQNVNWGELDYLFVDLPPGTGDAQISLTQTLPLDGALIVTTPQAAAYTVALRGAGLFDKVDVPVLGVAENMSHLEMSDGSIQHLFGEGGGEKVAAALNSELLGKIPLDQLIREGGDRGIPHTVGIVEDNASASFDKIVTKLVAKVEN